MEDKPRQANSMLSIASIQKSDPNTPDLNVKPVNNK